MGITTTTVTDDTGGGIDGTVANNAWLQALFATLDARWSEITTTATGTQNNLSITSASIEADVLRCNNASLLTLTSIAAPSPAKPAKKLIIVSVGAGQVDINDSSAALGTAANRIVTGTSGTISLAPGLGRAIVEYDATTARWRLALHEQGQIIGYTSTWAASGTAVSLGNATLNAHFYTRGKQVRVHIYFAPGTTTTFGTGSYTFTLPFTASSTVVGQTGTGMIFDVSASAFFVGAVYVNTTTTLTVVTNTGQIGQTVPMTWAAGTGDLLLATVTYYLP